MNFTWTLKKFNDLSAAELYAVLQLRSKVFVLEQNCVYQDMDGKDPQCFHFMCWDENVLVAYTRIIPPGLAFNEASIGRVVSSPQYRGRGAGQELMKRSIDNTFSLFNCTEIKIGAQLYLKKFYQNLGFVQCSKIYLEDNIEHIEMILKK